MRSHSMRSQFTIVPLISMRIFSYLFSQITTTTCVRAGSAVCHSALPAHAVRPPPPPHASLTLQEARPRALDRAATSHARARARADAAAAVAVAFVALLPGPPPSGPPDVRDDGTSSPLPLCSAGTRADDALILFLVWPRVHCRLGDGRACRARCP